MPPEDDLGEKTEDATPRRREEAREQGQVALSKDLCASVLLLVGFSTILILGKWMGEGFLGLIRKPLENLDAMWGTPDNVIAEGVMGAVALATYLLPLLGVLLVLSVLVPLVQVGFHITPKAFELKLDRFNPISGIGRLFSMRSSVKLGIGIAKITVVAAVLTHILLGELPKIMSHMGLFDGVSNNSRIIVAYLLEMICWLGIYAGGTLTVLALIDYAYQRWQHSKDMMMSKQEVKEEMKNMEGDPLIKRKRLERARALAQKRMMNQVPKADVVVTNPTHYSVALRYHDGDHAPRLLAKGADMLALKIREVASEYNIPIVEKPELARALYRWVEVDEFIPDKYWAPVAEVLSYVYQMDKKKAKRAGVEETVQN